MIFIIVYAYQYHDSYWGLVLINLNIDQYFKLNLNAVHLKYLSIKSLISNLSNNLMERFVLPGHLPINSLAYYVSRRLSSIVNTFHPFLFEDKLRVVTVGNSTSIIVAY